MWTFKCHVFQSIDNLLLLYGRSTASEPGFYGLGGGRGDFDACYPMPIDIAFFQAYISSIIGIVPRLRCVLWESINNSSDEFLQCHQKST